MTALGGALLFSALVAQASGPTVADAGAAPPPSIPMPDAAAETDGPLAPGFPPTPLPWAPAPPTTSRLSSQNIPLVPAPRPTGPQPADANQPVGIWEPPHYDEGFVLVSTPELDHVSQFRYATPVLWTQFLLRF